MLNTCVGSDVLLVMVRRVSVSKMSQVAHRLCTEDVAIDFLYLKKTINSVPLRLSFLFSASSTEMLQSGGQINCFMGSITFKTR